MGAHETLSTDHSALRVSCPTNFESTVGVSAVQSPLESLNNWNLTPLPAFKANLSQFSDVDSSQVINGPVQDFVPNGMTKIIHLFLTRSRAGYDLSLDQFAELLTKFDKYCRAHCVICFGQILIHLAGNIAYFLTQL